MFVDGQVIEFVQCDVSGMLFGYFCVEKQVGVEVVGVVEVYGDCVYDVVFVLGCVDDVVVFVVVVVVFMGYGQVMVVVVLFDQFEGIIFQ